MFTPIATTPFLLLVFICLSAVVGGIFTTLIAYKKRQEANENRIARITTELCHLSSKTEAGVAVMQMLYWKGHIKKIPAEEFEELKKNGFLVLSNSIKGMYTWSDFSNDLHRDFMKKFPIF